MSTDSPPPQDAPAPFSGEPDPEESIPPPDFILRSGDGVDLHVHKDILKFVSVFFKNMLDGAGDPTEIQRDGKPIVVLPEPSAVLYRLLCLAYPGHSLDHYSLAAQSLDGVWVVHAAANKYLFIGVQKLLKSMLENPALLDAHPHRVFAIARLCELPDVARKAALSTLKSPVCPPGLTFPEMELLPAVTVQKLYEFHHSCGTAAQKIVELNAGYMDPDYATNPIPHRIFSTTDTHEKFVWLEAGSGDYHDADCRPHGRWNAMGEMERAPSQWFRNHAARIAAQLNAIPRPHTAETEAVKLAPADLADINGCHACSADAVLHLESFARQLAVHIEASNLHFAQDF
ncbi:hypothetical protein DFH09DRAFT_1283121 [Mycena vulgaris]|nr:hypothetical protein DFH09DRAFT_1283121 [Mycena vulgaris]